MALILLLGSLTMTVPLAAVAREAWRGEELAVGTWLWPLLILATGSALTWLLTKRQIPLHLYLAAFALWMLTAGYFWFTRLVQ